MVVGPTAFKYPQPNSTTSSAPLTQQMPIHGISHASTITVLPLIVMLLKIGGNL